MWESIRGRFLSDGFADEFSEEFVESLVGPVSDEVSERVDQLVRDCQRGYTPEEARMVAVHRCYNGLPEDADGTQPYAR